MSPERTESPTRCDVVPIANAPIVNVAKRKNSKKTNKRFLWHDDLHLRFVSAIFDLGLKNASPKSLLSLMEVSSPGSGLTTEHLKSHLQKYRLNYQRAHEEFQELCDRQAKRSRKRHRRHGNRSKSAFIFPFREGKRRKGSHSRVTDTDNDSELECGESSATATSMERGEGLSSFDCGRHASGYPVGYLPVQRPGSIYTTNVIDPQWSTFNMMMSTPSPVIDALSIQASTQSVQDQLRAQEKMQMQMQQAMQAQMNFHRQMLTRKGELSLQREGFDANGYGDYGRDYQTAGAWPTTQHIQQQQQMNQYVDTQEPPQQVAPRKLSDVSGATLPTLIATPQAESADSDDANSDVYRWDRLTLNVDLDDDDLFDFLKA
ncbi:hypothetical protein PHYBOEH_001799 [Phytophthora boehmeriae]|uniref:Myb-like domain-containing protein n=1 Tax=Phytophthora boehmeriae TaxID=109152 RepID=A0A8T1WUB5_9STRA|nr:hypothetical protein PHYBOEH_001799 [Phytophthora boehmeriae]